MKKKKLWSLVLVIALLIQVFNLNSVAALVAKDQKTYIIGLKQGINVDNFVYGKGLKLKGPKKLQTLNMVVSELDDRELQEMNLDPEVAFIETDSPVSIASVGQVNKKHDYVVKMATQVQTVPWGIQDIGVDKALENQLDGKQIRIAVLDTGITEHQDLKISGGVSFVDGIKNYSDDNGHGTHVAGTIAAKDNNFGVVGAASGSKIYSVKVLDNSGSGTYSQVIQGIDWAISNGLNVINMSFGGSADSQALHDAVIKASNNRILFVAAAGNAGTGEDTILYPAKYPEVIAVGAVDRNHKRASFSSTGLELDIVAPGVDILSTIISGSYGVLSGTSMATPHVTGAIASLWSQNNSLSSEEIKQKLYQSATPLGSVNEYGHGMVDLDRALGFDNAPVNPPTEIIPPSEPPSSTVGFNIVDQDKKLLDLSNQLLDLIQKAKASGNIALSKNIENQYNMLLIKNNEFHQLPSELKNFTKEDVSAKNFAENNYYKSIESTFTKLENEYKSLVINFEKQVSESTVPNDTTGSNSSVLDNNVNTSSYDFVGDGQTITPGGGATVSLKLFEAKSAVYVKVFNVNTPSTIVASTTFYNKLANSQVSYTWYSSSSTPTGTYRIEFSYPNITTVEYFTIYVTSSSTLYSLYNNSPVNVSLGTGQYRLYKFTPSTTGLYKFYTGPYAGTGGSNDTFLELFDDPNMTNMIISNDDSNGTLFSEIKHELNAGQTYYLKLRPYSSSGSLYCSLTVSLVTAIYPIYYNTPIDIDLAAGASRIYKFIPPNSANYKVSTGYYGGSSSSGSSDTILTMYNDYNLTSEIGYNDDANGSLFSEIKMAMSGGTGYYIKLGGYNGSSVHARITATVDAPQTPTFVTMTNKTPIDVSKPAGESAYFKFTPLTSGLYRFFTGPYQGTGAENDTFLHLYTDSALTNQVTLNDDVSDSPYGSLFSKIEYNLTAGTTYYIKLRHYTSYESLNARFTVEDDFDSVRTSATPAQWGQILPGDLTSRYDVDYYRLDLLEMGDIQLLLQAGKAILEDSNGNTLATFYPGDGLTYTPTQTGVYYVKVCYDPAAGGLKATDVLAQSLSPNVQAVKSKLEFESSSYVVATPTPTDRKKVRIFYTFDTAHDWARLEVLNSANTVVHSTTLYTQSDHTTLFWDWFGSVADGKGADFNGVDFARDGQYKIRIVPSNTAAQYYIVSKPFSVINRVPVVFVPGTAGTQLYYTDTDGSTRRSWVPEFSSDLEKQKKDINAMALDSNGTTYNSSLGGKPIRYNDGSPGLLQEAYADGIGVNIYKNVVSELNSRYTENLTVFYATWDWRKALKNGEDLRLKAILQQAYNKSGSDNVDIISHSQGCLLARTYLLQYGNEKPTVRRWIAVGEPLLGVYKTYQAIEYGYDFGVPHVKPSYVKPVAKNMPAIYNMFPSKYLVDKYGPYTGFNTWNFNELETYLKTNNIVNQTLYDNGKQFQGWLLSASISSSTKVYKIVGSGENTYARLDPILLSDSFTESNYQTGDGTVPLVSADTAQVISNPVSDSNSEIWYADDDHVGLMQGEILTELIMNLLVNGYSTDDNDFLSTNDYRRKNSSGNNYYTLNGWLLTVSSDADIIVADEQGKEISPEINGKTKIVWLKNRKGKNYKVKVQGLKQGDTIELIEYKDDKIVERKFIDPKSVDVKNLKIGQM